MTFIDNYPYNIEAAQKLYILWSPEIEWDFEQGYPRGDENVFEWSDTFMPYKDSPDGVNVYHVWMKYKIGDKGEWSLPMRVNYPTVVIGPKGEKGEQGEKGDRGIRGATGKSVEMQFADADYNIVPETSSLIVFVRIRVEGSNWSSWIRIAGINGVGDGGIGLPPGGLPGQLIQRTPSSYVWIDEDDVYNDTDAVNAMGALDDSNPLNHNRYTDSEAVNAMGLKDNTNPLNHDRYTDAEAIAAVQGSLSGTLPIEVTGGIISHNNADGYRHIPIGGVNGESLRTDGSGNYTWERPLNASQLNDSAGAGDTNLIFSASKVLELLGIASYGIRYVVNLQIDLADITEMSTGDLAVVNNDTSYPNRPVYRYDGTNWVYLFDLDSTHNHDNRYYTESELNTPGTGPLVDWTNIANISGLSPIVIGTNNRIEHNTFTDISTSNPVGTFIQNVQVDGFGHLVGVTSAKSADAAIPLENVLNSLVIEGFDGTSWVTVDYNPFDYTYNRYRLYIDYNDNGLSNPGVSDYPARNDHYHDDRYYTETELSTADTGNLVDWSNVFNSGGLSTTILYVDTDGNNRYMTFNKGILIEEGSGVPGVPVGSFSKDLIFMAVDTTTTVDITWDTNGSSDTGWEVVRTLGDVSITPLSGGTNSDTLTLSSAASVAGKNTFELRSVPSGTVLDTLTVEVS